MAGVEEVGMRVGGRGLAKGYDFTLSKVKNYCESWSFRITEEYMKSQPLNVPLPKAYCNVSVLVQC